MCFKLDSFGAGVHSPFSVSYFVLPENSPFPQLTPWPLYIFLVSVVIVLIGLKTKVRELQLCTTV